MDFSTWEVEKTQNQKKILKPLYKMCILDFAFLNNPEFNFMTKSDFCCILKVEILQPN